MDDFVVRRFDGITFNNLYFGFGGEWVNSSEKALKMDWQEAEFIRAYYMDKNEDALFDLAIRKDSEIDEVTNELVSL